MRSMPVNEILQTQNLTKRFRGKAAVNNVSMTVYKGDIYGFIGRNGAGKTTFMRAVLDMTIPASGDIRFFGGAPFCKAAHRIGSLIENPGLSQSRSAYENMKEFSILTKSTDEEINQILSLVGLSDTKGKKVKNFSLGMKQRLGIALSMLGNPEFIILDEPVNGLDPTGIKEIRDIILRLNQQMNITFLISSHMLDELSKIATRYGIIDNGILIEELTASELEKRCRHKLKITVDDVQKAYGVLLKIVAPDDMVICDNSILLSSHLNDGGKMNGLLCANAVMVSGIEIQSGGLEQFFMERIGE